MLGRTIVTSVLIGLCWAGAAWAQNPAQLGNAAFEDGKFAEAVVHYHKALREQPVFGVCINLGHSYAKLERWSEAAASYQAAIELDAAAVTGDIWLFLGQAQYQAQRREAALEAFLAAAAAGAEKEAGVWIARCLIEQEQWLRAKAALLRYLGGNPEDREALELLAYVLGQMNDQQGTVDVYRELVAAAPEETKYRVALANALAVGGQNGQAIDMLETAWRIDRGATTQINRLLADLYLAEQMPHEAALCYARAIGETEEPSADDYFRLSMAYFQSKELVSAKAALGDMRRADPEDLRIDLYLGHIASEEGDPNGAEQHYLAALTKRVTSTETLLALGQLQMKQERFETAAGCFERVLELGDHRAVVYTNHILALLRTPEREQETRAALKAALAWHPGDAQIQQLLDRYISRTRPERESAVQ